MERVGPLSISEFLQTTPAQFILYTAILCALVAIGYHVVRSFRDRMSQDSPGASERLTNFRELYEEGDIDDEEYRGIKTVLGEKLQQELNDTESKG